MRRVEVWLVEVETDAAIEGRPACMYAGRPRPAQEVQMVILGIDARLLFRAVADAEVHALVAAFGDGDAHRNLIGLIGRRRLRRLSRLTRIACLVRGGWLWRLLIAGHRLDVRELKQLEPVQPPL